MFDETAGRSAGTPHNEELDPTRPRRRGRLRRFTADVRERARDELRDVTAGRSAGTEWNAAKDPTRPVSPDDAQR
jgi:hypothetical protein